MTFLLLVACGENTDSVSTASSQKAIHSAWTSTENGAVLNFESLLIGQEQDISFALVNEKTCRCDVIAIGTNYNGTITTSNCTELSAGTSSTPSCTDLESAPTYEIENSLLTLCGDDGCSEWE